MITWSGVLGSNEEGLLMLQDWGDKNVLKSMVAVNTADINGELYEMRIKSQSCKGGDRKVRSRPRGRCGTWIVKSQR